jgi:hypothetical protein
MVIMPASVSAAYEVSNANDGIPVLLDTPGMRGDVASTSGAVSGPPPGTILYGIGVMVANGQNCIDVHGTHDGCPLSGCA